jgi:hypothetical protein
MTTRAAVDLARQELLASSDADIERATAEKWCARAIAAYDLAAERRCMRWLARAVIYHHEACEHGSGVSPVFLHHVELVLEPCKAMALEALGGPSAW